MDPLLSYLQDKQSDLILFLKELVECESPSDDPAGVNRFMELFADRVSGLAKTRMLKGGPRFGNHLRCEFELPGRRKSGQILAIGHGDTVWALGKLKEMPFREQDGRLWGPGVLDMKSGLAFFVFAMRALRELELPVASKVVLLIVSDEEIGSESSRPITEAEARKSGMALVLEPGTGLQGKLKTARKGVGDYTIEVKGKASHAGVDFEAGANAIVELARQIGNIASFTDLSRGITVNPGVIAGGTRTNVVAEDARVEVDIRIARAKDGPALDRKFRRLKPVDTRCVLTVSGGLNRPPMERTPGIVKLFRKARAMALELGVRIEESSTGGGSDGNFVAGMGVPVLDGIGGVGEGAHAANESILVNRIADRAALIARLVQSGPG
jgi:glutamate carboxypeptidase